MRQYPKLLSLAVGLFVLLLPLAGFDIGGVIRNTSELDLPLDGGDLAFVQTEQADLWVSLNFDAYTSFYLKGYGKLIIPADGSDLGFGYNLESFLFSATIPSAFGTGSSESLKIGRTRWSDPSAMVLSHVLDGIESVTSLQDLEIRLWAATSILQFKESSGLILSHADLVDVLDEGIFLAPPRILGDLDFSFNRIFLRQNLQMGALAQFDLRQNLLAEGESLTSTNTSGGRTDNAYVYLGLNGPLSEAIFYRLTGYMSMGSAVVSTGGYVNGATLERKTILGGMGSLQVNAYLPQALNSTISFTTTLGSWDSDATAGTPESDTSGSYSQFQGLTAYAPDLLFNPGLGNIWASKLEYSIRPVDALQLALGGKVFIRPNPGAIGDGSITVLDSQDLYLGTEARLGIQARLTSDLGMSLDGAIFIPNSNVLDIGNLLGLTAKINLNI